MDAAVNSKSAAAATAWHAITVNEVLKRLTTSTEKGLDASEASTRLQKYGPNRLPEGKKRGPFMRFLAQLNNILVYVLLGAGFVKLMLGLWLDAGIIFGVVLLNALLGFIQEGKAEKALDSIRNMLSAEARTTRGGETRMIPADELVPGDIVLLESGDKVPADLRLADAKNLRTEEAALTGESVPAEKTTDPVAEKSTVGDRDSMAFSGTMVVSGRATGVVVATGSETELGRINQLLASVSALETPLLRQIKNLGYLITAAVGVVGVLVFAYGRWVMGMEFVELFQAIVGIAVSLIPEGLPALITITLAIGVQRMAQRNAIIRRLPAVETLGSVSRICSDKTGTLDFDGDDGRIGCHRRIGVPGHRQRLRTRGRGQAGREAGGQEGPGARAARPRVDALQRRRAVSAGRGVEGRGRSDGGGALSVRDQARDGQASRAEGVSRGSTPSRSSRSTSSWRRSTRAPTAKRYCWSRARPRSSSRIATGSRPETARPHRSTASDSRRSRTSSPARASVCSGSRGSRAPGVKAGTLGPADLPKNLVLLGLIGLLDPPRKEAIEAVKECHGGGIRVTMITGDHKITAAAIAKMLGIGDGKTAVAGAEIEEMNEAALQETVRDVDVFARASPEHKLRLVKAIQANRQIVAMTGDGVNDAPSLKKADIGVAMGIKGTEVTKEAAGMILADDNFASIGAAVKEGRTVYNNIEKAILFLFPTNVAQALVIAVAIFLGFTLPITAPQVLWVNMVTSVALGLVLCFEPHELDVMSRPPRAVDRPILTGFGIWRVIFVGLALLAVTLWAFFWMKSQNASDQLARTVAVNMITIGQVFYLLNSRYLLDTSLSFKAHLGNKYLPLGIGAVIILQLLFTYAPPLQLLFDNEAIPLWVWPRLFLGGLIFFLVVEAEKMIIRSSGSLRSAVTAVEAGA